LTPADVVAAKLAVQLKLVDADVVRAEMHQSDKDDDLTYDLIARLHARGALKAANVKQVRRYSAMFDHVRREAIYLRQVEKRQPPLSTADVGEVLARVEKDSYRRRLGAVLVDLGHITVEEAHQIDTKTRQSIQHEDLKVLKRYRAQQFEGVGRPLLPTSLVDTGVFKVSTLFRSKRTLRFVRKALLRLQEEEICKTAILEFVPADSDDALVPYQPQDEEDVGVKTVMEIDPEEEEAEVQHMGTARWRRKLEPEPEEGLGELKQIDRYQIVEVLGQGGMGAVYLAQEEGMGPMVAVKVMLAEKAKEDDVARFVREAKICKMLEHPAVVSLFDLGRTKAGLDYMAIPFFVGKDLKAVLDDTSPMEPKLAFTIFEQICAGLEHCHAQRIVHRDLKPENIFVLAGGGNIKIVDFGIARLLDHDKPQEERLFETKVGVVSGSPAYLAPETITGGTIDARTDIYSLGIMFYLMLTGRLPLFAESPMDYLREHLVGVPLTLFQGKKDSSWNDEFEQLIASMLAKEPDDRPPSCQAILDLLASGLKERTLAQLANPPVEEDEKKVSKLSGVFNTFFKMLS
jgi:hypothetical protein